MSWVGTAARSRAQTTHLCITALTKLRPRISQNSCRNVLIVN